jgi:predicted nucleic acid-binding protein
LRLTFFYPKWQAPPSVGRDPRSSLRGQSASYFRVKQLYLLPIDSAVGLGAAILAANNGLGGADALYVEIARRLTVPLVTWDHNQLARASTFVAARSP